VPGPATKSRMTSTPNPGLTTNRSDPPPPTKVSYPARLQAHSPDRCR
jgi:hypothetical protein